MKKTIALLLILLMMPFFNVSFAASKEYNLSEIGMNLSIPDGYDVLTRDIDENNPVLSKYNFNVQNIKSMFESSGIYLNALPDPIDYEVVVTMFEDAGLKAVQNFNRLKEDQFKEIYDQIVLEGQKQQLDYESYSLYDHNGIRYMVLHTKPHLVQGVMMKTLQYYTVYNSKAYNVTLHSMTEELTEDMEKAAKEIVDTVSFTPSSPPPSEESSSSFKLGENIGYILGAVIVLALIVLGLTKFFKKKKEDQIL